MLPLKPELLASTATALAAWYGQQEPQHTDEDRATPKARQATASLRFVHFAGFWSHFAPHSSCSSWPLPAAEGLEELAQIAEQQGAMEPAPVVGDVFLLASYDARRLVLAGIVANVELETEMLDGSRQFICHTIEGELAPDVDEDALPPVVSARLVRRNLSTGLGDHFIRWCRFAPEATPAVIENEVAKDLVRVERVRLPKSLVRRYRLLRAEAR